MSSRHPIITRSRSRAHNVSSSERRTPNNGAFRPASRIPRNGTHTIRTPASASRTRSRSRSRRPRRRKMFKGGTSGAHITPPVSRSFGRRRRLNPAFVKKVLRCLQPNDVYENTTSGSLVCSANNRAQAMFGQPLMACAELSFMGARSDAIRNAAAVILTHNSGKYIIEKADLTHTLMNHSGQIMNLRAYFCEVRQDIAMEIGFNQDGATTNVSAQSGFLDKGYVDQTIVGTQPGENPANLPPGINTQLPLAGTLFSNPVFTSHCRIRSVQTFSLEPGAEKLFSIHQRSPRYISNGRIVLTSGVGGEAVPLTYIRGTKFWVFDIWGQPVVETNIAAAGVVSSSTTKLTCITRRRYEYYPSVTNAKYASAVSTLITPVSAQVVNVDTDVAQSTF